LLCLNSFHKNTATKTGIVNVLQLTPEPENHKGMRILERPVRLVKGQLVRFNTLSLGTLVGGKTDKRNVASCSRETRAMTHRQASQYARCATPLGHRNSLPANTRTIKIILPG
jgi:hypothetical protein